MLEAVSDCADRVSGSAIQISASDASTAIFFMRTVFMRTVSFGLKFSTTFTDYDLLETFDQIEIGEHSVISEDAGLRVWGHVDGADVFYAGGVGGHEFLPERALSGLHVEAGDAGGGAAGVINVGRGGGGAPRDWMFSLIKARDGVRVAAGDR